MSDQLKIDEAIKAKYRKEKPVYKVVSERSGEQLLSRWKSIAEAAEFFSDYYDVIADTLAFYIDDGVRDLNDPIRAELSFQFRSESGFRLTLKVIEA